MFINIRKSRFAIVRRTEIFRYPQYFTRHHGTSIAIFLKKVMKLMMLFGNEVIDIIKFRKTKLTPSYLLNLKEALIVRNEESLNIASDEPQFAIEKASAKVNAGSGFVFI